MRSRLIMNFMQASSSRASVPLTCVMASVTPSSISRSRVSSSFSRSRMVLSKGDEIPSRYLRRRPRRHPSRLRKLQSFA